MLKFIKKDIQSVKNNFMGIARFSKELINNFSSDVRKIKQAGSISKQEISFEQAVSAWGFGYGERGITMGRRSNLIIWVFGYILFGWSFYYFFRSIVYTNTIASATSCVGMFTGLFIGTISFWRWWVFKNKRYIPILKWIPRIAKSLTKGSMKLLLVLSFMTAMAVMSEPAYADNAQKIPDTNIDLPSGVAIEKDSDVTAAMFSRLFGPSWHVFAGSKSTIENVNGVSQLSTPKGGLGMFSGLIVAILGVLNFAAMTFVSVNVIYMWGIFAVTTAHEGKKLGGSQFNSLWVPVRHAMAVSLTVPLSHGLSLLQYVIMAMISLSINFANVVWDTAGSYIVEHAHTGIIDTAVPMFENDGYQLIPIAFQDMVTQELERVKMYDGEGEYSYNYEDNSYLNQKIKVTGRTLSADKDFIYGNGKEVYYINFAGEVEQNGRLMVEIDHGNGELRLSARPVVNLNIDSVGNVIIPYPRAEVVPLNDPYGYNYEKAMGYQIPKDAKTLKEYNNAKKMALVKIKSYAAVYRDVLPWAQYYLQNKDNEVSQNFASIIPSNTSIGSRQDADLIVQKLSKSLTIATKEIGDKIVQTDERKKEQIANSIDSLNGESTYGWASAGMFTFTLASLQKKTNEEILRRTSFAYREKNPNIGWFKNYKRTLNPHQKAAFKESPIFSAKVLLKGARYDAVGDMNHARGEDSDLSVIGSTIVDFFLKDEKGQHNENQKGGVLAVVLNEFAVYDPIVVMQSFGDRLLAAGNLCLALAIFTSFTVKSAFGFALVFAIYMAGITFAFVVPITPVIFWMRALISWMFLVVQAMVGAPFWACSHAIPEGHGFAGNQARKGYIMLLDILIRPVLLVSGAVIAIAIIQAIGWLFSTLFNSWFANTIGTFIGMSFLGDITFAILVLSTMYYVSITIFTKGINFLPETIIAWVGNQGASVLGGMNNDETSTIVGRVGSVAGQGRGAMLAAGAGIGALGSSLQNRMRAGVDKGKEKGTGDVGKGDTPGQISADK